MMKQMVSQSSTTLMGYIYFRSYVKVDDFANIVLSKFEERSVSWKYTLCSDKENINVKYACTFTRETSVR